MNGVQAVFMGGSRSIQCLFRMALKDAQARLYSASRGCLGRFLPTAQNGSEGAEGAGCLVLLVEALAHEAYILKC